MMLRPARFVWRLQLAANKWSNGPIPVEFRRFVVAVAAEPRSSSVFRPPARSQNNDQTRKGSLPQNESKLDLDVILKNIKIEKAGKSHVETENDGLRQSLYSMRAYHGYFDPGTRKVALSSVDAQRVIDEIRNAENLSDPRDLIALLKKSAQLVFSSRRKLVEDPIFTLFADLLHDRLKSCGSLKFSDLFDLLQAFRQFRFDQLHHSFPPGNILRSIIDAKLIEMYPKLSRQEGFILSDMLYLSSCARLAKFPQYFISRQQAALTSYTPQELVRILLAISVQRSADPGYMLQLERLLLPHISGFSGVELAAICAGFFKSQIAPGIELMDKIVSRLQGLDAEDIANDVVLPSCAKFLAKYAQPALHDAMKNLMLKIKPYISRLNITSLSHVTGILEVTLHVDEDFLDRVTSRLVDRLPGSRLKDVAKITRTCSVVNYRPRIRGMDYFEHILEYSEKNLPSAECLKYPSKCVELLAAMARMGLFSERLMTIVSSPIFASEYRDQPDSLLVDLDFLQLFYAVEIDFPQRTSPLLDEASLRRMVRDLQSREGPINSALGSLSNGLLTLLNLSQSNAENMIAACTPLPYAERMLVLRLKNLDPLPLPQHILSRENPSVVHVPPKDGSCHVICYHPWWNYTSPMHQLTGFHEMKLRHLRALGYTVIAVDQVDTQNLTFVQKMKYLRDKLFFEKFDVSSVDPVPVQPDIQDPVKVAV